MRAQRLHFIRKVPDTEEIDEHHQQALLFDFVGQPHQRFAEFIEGFAAATGDHEIADLC